MAGSVTPNIAEINAGALKDFVFVFSFYPYTENSTDLSK